MVGFDPIFTNFLERIVITVTHRVLLSFYCMLLQSCIHFTHGQRHGCCTDILPCFQINIQVRCTKFKALHIFRCCQFFCCCYNSGTAIHIPQQLKVRFFTDDFFHFITKIAFPNFHKMVIATVNIRQCIYVCQICKG